MILLRTMLLVYGVFLEYYFKLQFGGSWSIHGKACHEKMQILSCILPIKTELPPEKN